MDTLRTELVGNVGNIENVESDFMDSLENRDAANDFLLFSGLVLFEFAAAKDNP